MYNEDSLMESYLCFDAEKCNKSLREEVDYFANITKDSNYMDLFREKLGKEYDRYLNKKNTDLCKSNANFDDYYATIGLLSRKIMDSETESYTISEIDKKWVKDSLNDWNKYHTEDEFFALEKKAVDFLKSLNMESVFDGGFPAGQHEVFFLYYLAYRIDELSMDMLDIIYSNSYTAKEKIKFAGIVFLVKGVLEQIKSTYICDWKCVRQGHPGHEFAVGFYKGYFHTSGGTIDRFSSASSLSLYSNYRLFYYLIKDKKIDSNILRLFDSAEEEADSILQSIQESGDFDDIEKIITLPNGYTPLSLMEIDNLIFCNNCSEEENNRIFHYIQAQGIVPVLDLYISIIRNCDLSPEISTEFIDSKLRKINSKRNSIVDRLFYSINYARQSIDKSVDQIENSERIVEERVRRLDDLQGLLITCSIDDISPFMTKQKSIIDEFQQYEYAGDSKLIERFNLIVEEMTNKITGYEKEQKSTSELYRELESDIHISDLEVKENVIKALCGGERLYRQFIEGKKENPEFDYSCIALMYYKALESLLYKFLYLEYLRYCGIDINEISEKNDERNSIFFDGRIRLKTFTNYKGENKKTQFPQYMELGSYIYFINTKNIGKCYTLKNFITQKLGIAKPNDLVVYVEKVNQVRIDRNSTVHAGHVVTYDEAANAKISVYPHGIAELSGLIQEFLDMIHLSK